jgi:hypothetical protein
MAACMVYWDPRSDMPRWGDGGTPGVNGRHVGWGLHGSGSCDTPLLGAIKTWEGSYGRP